MHLYVKPQRLSHLTPKTTRDLTWKAQASNVLPNFPHHRLAPACSRCCHTCVSLLQPIGKCSQEHTHEVLPPVSRNKLVFHHFWDVMQAVVVAPWRSYDSDAGIQGFW